MGTLTISQKKFADELVNFVCVTSTQSIPLRVGVKLEEFNEDKGRKLAVPRVSG